MKNTKAPNIRTRLANYLLAMLSTYNYDTVLEKHSAAIESFLLLALTDASAEARSFGRKCFLLWHNMANSQDLFSRLDYAVQKAIQDEMETFSALDYLNASISTTKSHHLDVPSSAARTRKPKTPARTNRSKDQFVSPSSTIPNKKVASQRKRDE